MKTFEERYTAWIDGQLTGTALAAFEQELARRAEAGDAAAAETDKAAALQLRSLLKEHLQAPALGNTEFFSHQMRERIDAEVDKAAARREAAARPAFRFPAFVWPFARFAGVGVLCLFVAGALYYGMVPAHPQANPQIASATPAPQQTPGDQVAVSSPAPQPQAPGTGRAPDNALAMLQPSPTPVDLNDDIHVVPPTAGNTPSATSLHIGNAGVIWVTNPPYLPNVPAAASSPTSAPAASAAPSATP